MLADERQKLILEQVRLHGRVSAPEFARQLNVSEVTIRRDLNFLDSMGLLTRIHGGAVQRGQDQHGGPRPKLVGIVVPNSLHYFSEVIRGAETAADRMGVRLVLGVSNSGAFEQDRVQRMVDLGVEGILLATATGDADPDAAKWLDTVRIPTVLMERAFTSPGLEREMSHVRTDHSYGAYLALKHLHDLGHRSIAVAMAETATSHWLRLGCEKAWNVLKLEKQSPHADLGPLPGEADLDKFLQRSLEHGSTAFFVHNDMAAALLLEVALQRGLRIPEDAAVVAYDDVAAAMAPVPLTAVAPPKRAVGALALEQLLRERGYASSAPAPISHQALLPTLKIRESSGVGP